MDGGKVELLVILGGNPVFTRAGRPQVRRAAREGPARRLPRPLRRRNGGSLPLERRRPHPLEIVGRRAGVRRHRHADPAAHRAALRRTLGARARQRARRPGRTHAARHRQGLLDARVRRAGGLDLPRRRRPAVLRRRPVLEARAPRRLHPGHVDRGRRPRTPSHPPDWRRRAPGSCRLRGCSSCGESLQARRRRSSHTGGNTSRRLRRPPSASRLHPSPRCRPRSHQAAGQRPPGQPPSPARSSAAQGSRSSSARIRPSGTAASPTTAGCRSCPKPLTKITWDATAWMHPSLAEQHGLRDGDVIELRYRGNTARMPIFRVGGHPRQSVTVFFGYGRRMAGRVGNAEGIAQQFNAVPPAHVGRAVVRHRSGNREDRRPPPARHHAGTPPDGRPQPRAGRRPSRSTCASRRSSREMGEKPPAR